MIIEHFPLTLLTHLRSLTNCDKKMPFTKRTLCSYLKIKGYLIFFFFNGWNKPLTRLLEKVGTFPDLPRTGKGFYNAQNIESVNFKRYRLTFSRVRQDF